MNIDKSKSYATEANLTAALAAINLQTYRHIVVRNRDGRWTAIFAATQGPSIHAHAPAFHGFMVFG